MTLLEYSSLLTNTKTYSPQKLFTCLGNTSLFPNKQQNVTLSSFTLKDMFEMWAENQRKKNENVFLKLNYCQYGGFFFTLNVVFTSNENICNKALPFKPHTWKMMD